MYEAFSSPEVGALAVARHRRAMLNRRTYWATFGALALAWLVTSFGASAAVDEDSRSDTFEYMGGAGLVLMIGSFAVIMLVAGGRGIAARTAAYLRARAERGLSRRMHRVLVGGTVLVTSFSGGVLASWVAHVVGWPRLFLFVATSSVLFITLGALGSFLGTADDRYTATTEVVSEALAVRQLSALSPGELAILERLDQLEQATADLMEVPQSPLEAPLPQRFATWTAWWRARPRC